MANPETVPEQRGVTPERNDAAESPSTSAPANVNIREIYEQGAAVLKDLRGNVSETAKGILDGFNIFTDTSDGASRSPSKNESPNGATRDNGDKSNNIPKGAGGDQPKGTSTPTESQGNREKSNNIPKESTENQENSDKTPKDTPENQERIDKWNKSVTDKLGDTPQAAMMKELGKALITGDDAALAKVQKMMSELSLTSEQTDQLGEFQSQMQKQLGVDVRMGFKGNGNGKATMESLSLREQSNGHTFAAGLNIPRTGAITANELFRQGFAGPSVTDISVADAVRRLQGVHKK